MYGPLHEEMEKLVGEPVGVHLNLTGWISTTRNWHQDSYLNPPHVGDYYIAAWIALDTIHPDSGPFQYVKGSHKWAQVTREKILAALAPHERDHKWPTHSERLLTEAFEEEIERRGAEVTVHLPERGDVLLWHGRLLHRGTIANVPGMERRSLIAHFSGVNHRQDMPPAQKHAMGGYFFPINDPNRW
jgi:ectoine hydroxylase-related dioxygenase (phytanoyl-CoA dioxygenase family)